MSLLAQINNAAHTGAFGHNPRSEPTLAQLAAGNYKKGVVMVKGLSIAIENPAYTLGLTHFAKISAFCEHKGIENA